MEYHHTAVAGGECHRSVPRVGDKLGGRGGVAVGDWASSRRDFDGRCWTGAGYRPGQDSASSFRLDGLHPECVSVLVSRGL